MSQGSINWEDVRRRLTRSEDAVRETLSENPERMKMVFRQRAIQLARESAETKPASRLIPALIVRVAQERYAIALQELAEVLPFRGCTQVPGTSPQFLGVISLRGELRPVMDLSQILVGRPSVDSGAVLMLRRQTGLKVDAAEELREFRSDELTRPLQGRYVQALVSGTVPLLDIETMMSTVLSTKESRST